MTNSFKIRNASSPPLLRASAIVPKQVMKVINSIPGIAQVLMSHTGRVPMGMIEELRFSTKIIAVMIMVQAFAMALYTHVKGIPRRSPFQDERYSGVPAFPGIPSPSSMDEDGV